MKYLSEPAYRFAVNAILGFYDNMPDDEFIRKQYFLVFGRKVNLENPVTFYDKIQWLKIHDRNPEYNRIVDKYEAKIHAANLIGEEYIIPSYGVWENFDDIDFDALPNQFVLKCTHDSGSLVVVRDKNSHDMKQSRQFLKKRLRRNLYRYAREWVYKDVKPRILAEKYMEEAAGDALIDYKFLCFNGTPKFCEVITDRWTDESTDFFDMNWKHLDLMDLSNLAGQEHNNLRQPDRPKNFELMAEFATILARDTIFRRVDFYEIKGKVYFGEITFYPCAGLVLLAPDKWNKILGDMIVLPTER